MFYGQQLQHLVGSPIGKPAYGNVPEWEYNDPQNLPFQVDLQPVSMVTHSDGNREQPSETRYRFFTPEGCDLTLKRQDRFQWGDLVFDVDGFKRWPSADYPSGVDHVQVDLVLREG